MGPGQSQPNIMWSSGPGQYFPPKIIKNSGVLGQQYFPQKINKIVGLGGTLPFNNVLRGTFQTESVEQ